MSPTIKRTSGKVNLFTTKLRFHITLFISTELSILLAWLDCKKLYSLARTIHIKTSLNVSGSQNESVQYTMVLAQVEENKNVSLWISNWRGEKSRLLTLSLFSLVRCLLRLFALQLLFLRLVSPHGSNEVDYAFGWKNCILPYKVTNELTVASSGLHSNAVAGK